MRIKYVLKLIDFYLESNVFSIKTKRALFDNLVRKL